MHRGGLLPPTGARKGVPKTALDIEKTVAARVRHPEARLALV